MNCKNKIYVIGIGPGKEIMMTGQAINALEQCDIIIGYTAYIELLGDRFKNKEFLSTPMKKEIDRCKMAFEKAQEGKKVAMICSGDAGVYGMASPMYELSKNYEDCELEIIPGITAANSGAACLGAPLNHDFCVISLSDLLTPWEVIEKRLEMAAQGDFCIAIYNPSSKKRSDYLKKACEILEKYIPNDRVCGYVENIGREGTFTKICTLKELKDASVNMFTTVFIGNSQTEVICGKMVAKRGYHV